MENTDKQRSEVGEKESEKPLSKKEVVSALLLLVIIAGSVIVIGLHLFSNSSDSGPDSGSLTETWDPADELVWSLKFKEGNVEIHRSSAGDVEGTFWRKRVGLRMKEGQTIELLGAPLRSVEGLVYDPGEDIYYDFNPGGYMQISIVTQDEYELLAQDQHSEELDGSGAMVINETGEYELEYIGSAASWKAIQRSSYHVLEGNDISDRETWIRHGFTVACLVPIEDTTSFLAFDEPVSVAGSERDMCEYISRMGIDRVERST